MFYRVNRRFSNLGRLLTVSFVASASCSQAAVEYGNLTLEAAKQGVGMKHLIIKVKPTTCPPMFSAFSIYLI